MRNNNRDDEWTVNTLCVYLVDKIEALALLHRERSEAQDKMNKATMDAATVATNKAEQSLRERAQASNEIRGALEDQGRLMMPRNESERVSTAHDKILDDLLARIGTLEGIRGGSQSTIGMVIGIVGTVLGVVGLIIAAITLIVSR